MEGFVFLSHAAEDDRVANAILNRLETGGIRCWIDHRDIPPGREWADVIVGALNNARIIVVVLSQHSNSSRFVLRELDRALAKGQAEIIPFRIHADVPTGAMEYFLCAHQFIDASGQTVERHIDTLARRVRTIFETERDAGESAGGPVIESTLDPSRIEDQTEFIARCRRLLESEGYAPHCAERIQYMLAELVANAAEHGCRFQSSERIWATCEANLSYARLIVEDSGPGFDAETVLERLKSSEDITRERGRGLLLVDHMCQRLTFRNEGRLAEAIVLKKEHPFDDASEPEAPAKRIIGDSAVIRIPGLNSVPVFLLADYLRSEMEMLKDSGFRHFIIDWGGIEVTGSDVMSFLMNNWKEFTIDKSGSIVFINVSAGLYSLFKVWLKGADVREIFPIKNDLAEALVHTRISR